MFKKYTRLAVPQATKQKLLAFADDRQYSKAIDILSRGNDGEILILDQEESLILSCLSGVYADDVELKFPYYFKEHPYFNVLHKDMNEAVNREVLQAVSSSIESAFPGRHGFRYTDVDRPVGIAPIHFPYSSNKDVVSLRVHRSIKELAFNYSRKHEYFRCAEILQRGSEDEVLVQGLDDGFQLNLLCGVYRDDVRLKFPYYDDEDPLHNTDHEEEFDVANGDFVMTIAFALHAGFPDFFNIEAANARREAREASCA